MTEETQHLLRRYVDNGSEEAFRQIVLDHVDLVHATALRILCGDRPLAEEVTQTVFISLARKARALSASVILSAWLYRHARFTALRARRAEHRRIERERQAMMISDETDTDALWRQVAPLLDDSLGRMREADRSALVARFLQGKDLKAVGQELGLSEDAAQKRVARALEKLRLRLGKRGIVSSASLLAYTLHHAANRNIAGELAGKITQRALAPIGAASLASNNIGTWLLMKKSILTTISITAGLGLAVAWLGPKFWKGSPVEAQTPAPASSLLLGRQPIANGAQKAANFTPLTAQAKLEKAKELGKRVLEMRTSSYRTMVEQFSALSGAVNESLSEEERKEASEIRVSAKAYGTEIQAFRLGWELYCQALYIELKPTGAPEPQAAPKVPESNPAPSRSALTAREMLEQSTDGMAAKLSDDSSTELREEVSRLMIGIARAEREKFHEQRSRIIEGKPATAPDPGRPSVEEVRAEATRKILEIAPDSAVGYDMLGRDFTSKRKFAEARQAFEAGLARVPNDPALLHNLGRLELTQGNDAEATKWFHAAAAPRGHMPAILVYLQEAQSHSSIAEQMKKPMVELPMEECFLMQATIAAAQQRPEEAQLWIKEAGQLGDIGASPWINAMTQRGFVRKTVDGYAVIRTGL